MQVTADFRRRGSRTDYQQIVVVWQPAILVVSSEDIDFSQQRVEMQVEDGAWTGLEVSPIKKRGKYRATFEVAPCKSHHFRLVLSSLSGEEATYHYPLQWARPQRRTFSPPDSHQGHPLR